MNKRSAHSTKVTTIKCIYNNEYEMAAYVVCILYIVYTRICKLMMKWKRKFNFSIERSQWLSSDLHMFEIVLTIRRLFICLSDHCILINIWHDFIHSKENLLLSVLIEFNTCITWRSKNPNRNVFAISKQLFSFHIQKSVPI